MGACFLCTEVEGFDSHTVHTSSVIEGVEVYFSVSPIQIISASLTTQAT